MTLEELIENFEFLDDWEDRYRYLIDLGRELPPLEEAARIDANKVEGCMSQVWLVAEGTGAEAPLTLRADSDAAIVKGLIAVLLIAFSGKTPAQILATDIGSQFARIGLEQHLSPSRTNGLHAMIETIRRHAQKIQAAG